MKREFVFGSVWKNLHAIYFLTKLALRLNDGGREIWIFHKNRSILCKYENRSSLAQSVFIKMLIRIIIAGKISMDFQFDQWSTITELPSPKITVPEAKIWDPLSRPNYTPYTAAKVIFLPLFLIPTPPLWQYIVPNGHPNPTRYQVFFSILDPTRFSFENHWEAL